MRKIPGEHDWGAPAPPGRAAGKLRLLPLLITIVAAVGLGLSGNAWGAPGNVDAAVYSWARVNPDEPIPVLIEVAAHADRIEERIRDSGGAVERRFAVAPLIEADLAPSSLRSIAAADGVEWVSLDAPVVSAGFVETSALASAYPFAVDAPGAWNNGVTGESVGIAVMDTGVSNDEHPDFTADDDDDDSRFVAEVTISGSPNTDDGYGHGTHVAGIAGGDGDLLGGRYIGIAPHAHFIDVKIADDAGRATLSAAIAGIEWVIQNKDEYNIRVLNLSLHSSIPQSYRTDPLDAAVEAAWFEGIVVVAAAGNMGLAPDAVFYAPANDPFIIVVGASDDAGTGDIADDSLAPFSSRGVTQDGFAKPDIVAPGRRIVSTYDPASILAQQYPDRVVDGHYFRMSGTSMAAPVVSGIVALMLSHNPDLTPGEVKHNLLASSVPLPADDSVRLAQAGAATFYSGPSGNTDHQLSPAAFWRMGFVVRMGAITHVLTAPDPATEAAIVGLDLQSVGASNLETIDWDAIKWDAIKWDAIKWDAIKWDAIKWDAIKWDAIKWDAIKWDAIKWDAIKWDAIKWDAIKWDAIKWDAIKWDAITSTETAQATAEFSSTESGSVGFDFAEEN
jgi:serine protease AprX